MEITLPDYLTINDYKKIVSLEHLSDVDKMIEQVSILTKISKDEIRTWKGDSVMKIIDKIYSLINGAQPEFYPLIEFEGQFEKRELGDVALLGEDATVCDDDTEWLIDVTFDGVLYDGDCIAVTDGVLVVLPVNVFVYLPVFVEHLDKDSRILLVDIGDWLVKLLFVEYGLYV